MQTGLVQWLLVPCLLLAIGASAHCQSTSSSTLDFEVAPNGAFSNSVGTAIPSGNPAASDLKVGTGLLGDWLGVNHHGFRLGGLNISDVNAQLTGGVEPGQWKTDSLTILDASLDLEERIGWKGAELGTELLFYSGGDIGGASGSVMGYNSLDGESPRTRFEVYTLWYRQYLFDETVSVRFGKLVPTYDFNNVVRPNPYSDSVYDIPAVSSAILTPLLISPTQLGVLPGYYNSATGMVTQFRPNDRCYVQYGLYDGNLAAGRQTGLEGPHFNGRNLHIIEGGADWTLGPEEKPGAFGAGYWKQTGMLSAPGGDVRGAEGAVLRATVSLVFGGLYFPVSFPPKPKLKFPFSSDPQGLARREVNERNLIHAPRQSTSF